MKRKYTLMEVSDSMVSYNQSRAKRCDKCDLFYFEQMCYSKYFGLEGGSCPCNNNSNLTIKLLPIKLKLKWL